MTNPDVTLSIPKFEFLFKAMQNSMKSEVNSLNMDLEGLRNQKRELNHQVII